MGQMDVARQIAESAAKRGWRVFAVGGYVRDMVLGRPAKDVDIEVYGRFTVAELVDFLRQFGNVDAVGRSFGVLKLTVGGVDLDVSVPRRESKKGWGHKGFVVNPDPTMTPAEAASRRDYTFNAMMYDIMADVVLDFYGGVSDLKNRRLRHVGPAFADDPLRVLRGFQFAARFDLTAEPETVALCRSLFTEYNTLPVERVWGEWAKWAAKGVRPSRGLVFLHRTGWVRAYPELARMLYRRPSVWERAKAAVDAVAGLDVPDRGMMVLASLVAHMDRPDTFLRRIGAPKRVAATALRMAAEMDTTPTTAADIRRLAVRLAPVTVRTWAAVVSAIGPDMTGHVSDAEALGVADTAPARILTGKHLIAAGLKPGPTFGRILAAAFEAQLEGEFVDESGALAWLRQHLG